MLISVKDLIKRSIELYKTKSEFILPYVWALLLPTALTTILSIGLAIFQDAANIPWFANTIVYALLAIALSIVSLWITIAFIRVTAKLLENKKPLPMKKELDEAKTLIWSTIVASIFSAVAIFAGALLFLIPGIIFAGWFAFTSQAVAIDRKHGVVALKTSKDLVVGRWWNVLGLVFFPALFFALVAWIAQIIVGIPLGFLLELVQDNAYGLFFGSATLAIIESFIAVLIVPLATAATTLLYLELKKNPVKKTTPPEVAA